MIRTFLPLQPILEILVYGKIFPYMFFRKLWWVIHINVHTFSPVSGLYIENFVKGCKSSVFLHVKSY